MSRRTAVGLETVPRREALEALARQYHHLQNEVASRRPGSGVRRRLEEKEAEIRERFERRLAEWVPDPELRRAWCDHLHNRAPTPPGPPPIRPLVFRGESVEAGSVVEIRGGRGEQLDVEVDGALVERVDADKDLASTNPDLVFRLDHTTFRETFNASAEALDALAAFVDNGGPPPWEHVEELLADGLIDPTFALTPRGRRAIARHTGRVPRRARAAS